jgi:hypothetical protein
MYPRLPFLNWSRPLVYRLITLRQSPFAETPRSASVCVPGYAQTAQRKRIDRDLVWRLMRFGDEPGSFSSSTAFDTTETKLASRQSVTARGE